MIYEYEVTEQNDFGLFWIDVRGHFFHSLDIYEFIGRSGYSGIFYFKPGSPADIEYGRTVTGPIVYDFKTRESLEEALDTGKLLEQSFLRIDTVDKELTKQQRKSLKYKGVPLKDIGMFSYVPFAERPQFHTSGEKKVPFIVDVKADLSRIDGSALLVNYLIMKNNSGVQLLPFEKEELVGTILGIRNFKIDSRILVHFGFTVAEAANNLNIRLAALKVREQKKTITSEQVEEIEELQFLKRVEATTAIAAETLQCNLRPPLTPQTLESLRTLIDSPTKFRPCVLLSGRPQVYWDLRSFTHIVMRHIGQFQIGSHAKKTALPYKMDDIKSLIKKVLGTIEEEIEEHFEESKGEFVRQGRMAVQFNGDFFHVRICPSGRLIQFHSVGKQQ